MNRILSPHEILKLIDRKDFAELKTLDRAITLSLFKAASENHPEIMNVCHHLTLLDVGDELDLNSLETAHVLIEEIIDPEQFIQEAVEILEHSSLDEKINSSLWMYLARGEFAQSEKFKTLLTLYYQDNPAFFSEVMSKTGNTSFLGIVENSLVEFSPFAKYFPMTEISHESFLPHDIWLRVGSSYVRLLQTQSKLNVKRLPDFLAQKFFINLPDSVEEWKKGATEEVRNRFEKFSKLYSLSVRGH